MKPLIFAGLFIAGIIGIWLALWNFIDYLTTGFNTGVWNWDIVATGFPSICAGIVIILIVTILGVKVLFK